jgi:hypothetical protein
VKYWILAASTFAVVACGGVVSRGSGDAGVSQGGAMSTGGAVNTGGVTPSGGSSVTSGSGGSIGASGSAGAISANGGWIGVSGSAGSTGEGGGNGGAAPRFNDCRVSADCGRDLICTFGLCHSECVTTNDCPSPERCVVNTVGNAGEWYEVCQLLVERTCHYNSDCAPPLVCAVDLQCRNQCGTDRDCTASQRCVVDVHVCAERYEIGTTGGLLGAYDAG